MRKAGSVSRTVAYAVAAIVALGLASVSSARADELTAVFDRLLTNPDDPALNIRYAELVEARGDTRKALAAYERALARNPGNRELQRGYRRIKRRLQPNVTAWTVEGGISWESNPLQVPEIDPRPRDDDVTYDLRVLMFDERTVARHRWRSLGEFRTQVQNDIDDLSDATVSFATGPVFDLGERSRLHIAPGTAAAWLDGDWLYHDVLLKLTFETVLAGTTQAISTSITSRDTNSKFMGSDGVIVAVNGRFTLTNRLRDGDAIYFLPRFRYSEASGNSGNRVFSNSLFPGNFVEAGARLVYYAPFARGRAFIGAGFGAHHRSYDQNVAFGTADREDWMLEPTVHLVVPRLAGSKFDVRVDYRYEHNDSNDAFEDFENHVVGVRTVRRF